MIDKIYKSLAFVLVILSFTNCADNIVDSVESIDQKDITVVVPTFSDIQENIFNKSCAFSGCHGANSISPDLSGNAYENVVNKSSSTGISYITPNNPTESYLLQKVTPDGNFQGSPMPLSASALSQEQIEAIIEWINDGAKNN